MDREARADQPPGWSVNPSAWKERLPIVALGFVGFVIAMYLTAFQYGWVGTVWEPFFGDGSRQILTSRVSHIFPIKDAALGAIGYLTDVVTGSLYGQDRWRTQPWMVIIFGIAVGPLGAGSVVLVILQPVLIGNFCTLCLVTALISVSMIGPAMDEVLASLQFVRRAVDEGRSWWDVFWGIGDAGRPTTAWAARNA
ncbi:MAG: vitamin K epoxide reductase family protein [Actinomycetota bacterium]|nr:vitamin K epoxide reductase family protein [Actinomycetota bacterium]